MSILYETGFQPNPRDKEWTRLHYNEFPGDFPYSAYPENQPSELIEELSRRLVVGKENLLITCGSDEALYFAFKTFFLGKKNILRPDITYGYYKVWATELGIDMKEVPLKDDFTIDAQDYSNADGIIIPNPNANTGLALSLAEVEGILKNNPEATVIIDEAYIEYANVESAVKLLGKYQNLLVTQTFSKAYPLANKRIGYAIGSAELISKLATTKNAINELSVTTDSHELALACLRNYDYYKKLRQEIIETRDWVVRELGCAPTQANFVLVKFENETQAERTFEALKNKKILVRRITKPERLGDYLRISIGTKKQMEEVIKCVKQHLKEKQKKLR